MLFSKLKIQEFWKSKLKVEGKEKPVREREGERGREGDIYMTEKVKCEGFY